MADVAIIGLSGESIFLEVDEFHKPGETITAKSVHVEPGGKGYNQAACLLKLGTSVSYLSTVGCDIYAEECIKYLDQKHATLFFKKISEEKTAIATILTDKYGNNQVTVYPGASKHLSRSHLNEFLNEIRIAKVLLLTLEIPLDVVYEAIKIANESNVKVILNPAPYKSEFSILNMCDIITPNEIEAKELFKIPLNDDIFGYSDYIKNNYLKDKLKTIIITLGSKGVLLITNDIVKHYKAMKVEAIDTTGAGDVFNASLTHFLVNGYSLDDAINYASIAASLSTTKKHVLNSLSDLNEVLLIKKV